MATDPIFDFYEKIVVIATDPSLSEIEGEPGTVLGRACGRDGRWSYAVWIDRTGVCWSCMEEHLRSTGEFDGRERFHNGTSIRVSQRGEIHL